MCPRSPLVEDRVRSVGRVLRDIVVPCRVPAQERLAYRAGVVASGRGRGGAGGAGEAAGAPPEPVVLPDEFPGLASLQGRLRQRQRRRILSYPLVIRLMIAMTLMPDASYCEALARLAGLLADIPFATEWHVPTEKVVTGWRLLVPANLMEALFWRAAGPLISDDEPSAVLLAGMMACAADGMLVNVADTEANRKRVPSGGVVRKRDLGPGDAHGPEFASLVAFFEEGVECELERSSGRSLGRKVNIHP